MLALRDAFVALFFLTVGVLINPRNLLSSAQFLLAIFLLVMVGKFIVWTAVVRLFRYPRRTATLVGVGLTQIGEFPFVLVQVARSNGLVIEACYSATLGVSLLSILANAALVRAAPQALSAISTRLSLK